jgi:hypothetical protein
VGLLKAENSKQITTEGRVNYLNSYPINSVNWGAPPQVKASVRIANDNENIYLHYHVSEKNVLGRYQLINEPVYKDSCVEFFIAFDAKYYYNFEFNCIGNVLAQYGTDRNNRKFLETSVVKSIKTDPSLGRDKVSILNTDLQWHLDIIIPVGAFQYSKLTSLAKTTARCNFYKCGDDLPEPHFLSWKPIISDTPDFHKPEFFGDLLFN